MDNNLDHYVVLGLLRNASTVEIRKAYLKLSLVYHPDKNNGAGADKFRQVSCVLGQTPPSLYNP